MSRLTQINAVKAYELALKKLQQPKYKDVQIWLHDYDELKNVRKSHLLFGLLSEYSDAVVRAVTGIIFPNCYLVFQYAAFDNKDNKNKRLYSENSRQIKVPYKTVKENIELGIKHKLARAKELVEKEAAAFEKWEKKVKKMPYKNSSMRIELSRGEFVVMALKPKEFDLYGEGSFLKNIKKGDVSISPEALSLLETIPERSGMMGLEVGLADRIMFASDTFALKGIPPEAVSVYSKSFKKMKKMFVIE